MRIRNKILLVYSIGVLAFLALFTVIEFNIHKKINFTLDLRRSELQKNVEDILDLNQDFYKSIVLEYTHRNSIIRLIHSKDTDWAKQNINILHNSKLNALWIFDAEKKEVYKNFDVLKLRNTVLPNVVFDSIFKYHNANFYLRTDTGLLQITASPVYDNYKKTELNGFDGYFILGKLWDRKYIKELEDVLNSEVQINFLNPDKTNTLDTNTLLKKDNVTLFFINQANDLQSKPIAQIIFKRKSQIIEAYHELDDFIKVFQGIFILFLIILLIVSFRRFIDYPLYVISEALNTGSTKRLKEISPHKDEFGKISKLIEDFFNQKSLLEEEIEVRKKAEESARISEANFRSLYETIVHGVIKTNPDGIILNANNAFVKVLNYSSESEVVGMNMEKDFYYSPGSRKIFLKHLTESGKVRNLELALKKKNGDPIICLVNADAIYNSHGKLLYIQGTVTDITDYKKLESQVQRLELAVKQALEGVALLDLNRNFEYVNDSWARMHGFSAAEMTGKNFDICYNPEKNVQRLINTVFEIVEDNGYYSGDIKQIKKDGSAFQTLMSCSFVKDYLGNNIGYVIIAADITERISTEEQIRILNKKLEQKVADQNKELFDANEKLIKTIETLQIKEKEITKSQQLHLSTINSLHEWVHFIDRDFNFVLINDAFLKVNKEIGIETDVIGKNMKDVYYFLEKQIFDEYDFVFETGKELITEEPTYLKDKYFYTETIKTPVLDSGNVVGVITTIRDITERKDMEKKILTAVVEAEEREKKRFSEDLHDGLGALLSTMKIYVNTIQKKKSINEANDLLTQLKDMIFDAVENTRNIAYNLTPNVLADFGLIKALTAYCDKLNSSQSIDVRFYSGFEGRFNHNIEINLFRIIQELINNSLKHGEARIIEISMQVTGNKLTVNYSDNGKGFNTEKIFAKNVNGIGINNIFARVKLLNGACKIISHNGGGTRVVIDINNFN
jgi:PAS domain S-box-containing protein